jgi:hypothetical protein
MTPESPEVLIHKIDMMRARKEQLARDLELRKPEIERTANTVGHMESAMAHKKASGGKVTQEEKATLRSAEGYLKKLVKEQTQWTKELNVVDRAIRDHLSELSKHSVNDYIKGLEVSGEKDVADSTRKEMIDLLREIREPKKHWDERFKNSCGSQIRSLPSEIEDQYSEQIPSAPAIDPEHLVSVMPNIPPETPSTSTMPNVPPEVPNMSEFFPAEQQKPYTEVFPSHEPDIADTVYLVPLPTPGAGMSVQPMTSSGFQGAAAPALFFIFIVRDFSYWINGKPIPGTGQSSDPYNQS